jgi:hypothetical protein
MVVVARLVLALSFALSACATVTGPEITAMERIAETLKQEKDPTKVFAPRARQ